MHAYISLNTGSPSAEIPIHYNHLVQSAIYAALPEDMAKRLHDEGFAAGKRGFKLFCFSRLQGRYIINKNTGTMIFPEGAKLVITSPDMEFFSALINSLLTKKDFRIRDSSMKVTGVECMDQVVRGDSLAVRYKKATPAA